MYWTLPKISINLISTSPYHVSSNLTLITPEVGFGKILTLFSKFPFSKPNIGSSSSLIIIVTCCSSNSFPFVTDKISTTTVSSDSSSKSWTEVIVDVPVVPEEIVIVLELKA